MAFRCGWTMGSAEEFDGTLGESWGCTHWWVLLSSGWVPLLGTRLLDVRHVSSTSSGDWAKNGPWTCASDGRRFRNASWESWVCNTMGTLFASDTGVRGGAVGRDGEVLPGLEDHVMDVDGGTDADDVAPSSPQVRERGEAVYICARQVAQAAGRRGRGNVARATDVGTQFELRPTRNPIAREYKQ